MEGRYRRGMRSAFENVALRSARNSKQTTDVAPTLWHRDANAGEDCTRERPLPYFLSARQRNHWRRRRSARGPAPRIRRPDDPDKGSTSSGTRTRPRIRTAKTRQTPGSLSSAKQHGETLAAVAGPRTRCRPRMFTSHDSPRNPHPRRHIPNRYRPIGCPAWIRTRTR